MILTIVIGVLAILTILYLFSSSDPVDPDVAKVIFKILIKYLMRSALLKCDDTGIFKFDKITLEGNFTISEEDITIFKKAVDSDAAVDVFLLTAKTTPLVVSILADPRCPIKPLGAVNTRNVIKQVPFDKTKPFQYTATFGGLPGKRKKRGVEFAITIDVAQDGLQVLHSESWFLQLLPRSFKPTAVEDAPQPHAVLSSNMPVIKITSLRLTSQHPLRWAASCKDYNPIHVSKLAARLFGFKSTIAHGNHVAAMLVADLDIRPSTMKLDFLRPMFLPATLDVTECGNVYNVGNNIRLTIDP